MHKNAREKRLTSITKPMLATLSKKVFSDEDWLFERKFDGIRVLVLKKNKVVSLYSRNQNKLNNSYPELVEAFEKLRSDNFIIDGELVALEKGLSSFSKLQSRMHIKCPKKALSKKVRVTFFAFDILYNKGFDLKQIPLIDRKKILKTAIPFTNAIKYTTHRLKTGESYLNYAAQKGWEGIIGKKIHSKYISSRSRNWLKFKCVNREEMIICGYTKPSGSRIGFGALLLGYYDRGKLKYAGKVGTGYNTEILKTLSKKLKKIERVNSPFETQKVAEKEAVWVSLKYVCQVEFTEWTKDGKLRHPSFLGLRNDKSPRSVTRKK